MPTSEVYFGDVVVGEEVHGASYTLTEEDIVRFALKWDPLAVHVDTAAASRSPFGGITAAGVHVLAIKQSLMHSLPIMESVICTMGFDEVRFREPARPGDTLTLHVHWREKRLSQSKPDRGIVVLEVTLTNQNKVVVLSYLDTILMRCRSAGG